MSAGPFPGRKRERESQELRMLSGTQCGGDLEKKGYAWDSAINLEKVFHTRA